VVTQLGDIGLVDLVGASIGVRIGLLRIARLRLALTERLLTALGQLQLDATASTYSFSLFEQLCGIGHQH